MAKLTDAQLKMLTAAKQVYDDAEANYWRGKNVVQSEVYMFVFGSAMRTAHALVAQGLLRHKPGTWDQWCHFSLCGGKGLYVRITRAGQRVLFQHASAAQLSRRS